MELSCESSVEGLVMWCTHCGSQIPDDARFCERCGSPVTPDYQEPNQNHYQQPYGDPYSQQPYGDPYPQQPYPQQPYGDPYESQPYEPQPYQQQPYEQQRPRNAASARSSRNARQKAPGNGLKFLFAALAVVVVIGFAGGFAYVKFKADKTQDPAAAQVASGTAQAPQDQQAAQPHTPANQQSGAAGASDKDATPQDGANLTPDMLSAIRTYDTSAGGKVPVVEEVELAWAKGPTPHSEYLRKSWFIYSYDDRYRLKAVTGSKYNYVDHAPINTHSYESTYTYTKDNLLKSHHYKMGTVHGRNTSSALDWTKEYRYDERNRLEDVSFRDNLKNDSSNEHYTYDNEGRLTGWGDVTLIYGKGSLPESLVRDGKTYELAFDGKGRLVSNGAINVSYEKGPSLTITPGPLGGSFDTFTLKGDGTRLVSAVQGNARTYNVKYDKDNALVKLVYLNSKGEYEHLTIKYRMVDAGKVNDKYMTGLSLFLPVGYGKGNYHPIDVQMDRGQLPEPVLKHTLRVVAELCPTLE